MLGLVTYNGKMRVTRQPIESIKNLYKGEPRTFRNSTLKEGENLLKDIKSKTFDMTAVFDLKDSKATSIDFQIAQVKFSYDIVKQQMGVGPKAWARTSFTDLGTLAFSQANTSKVRLAARHRSSVCSSSYSYVSYASYISSSFYPAPAPGRLRAPPGRSR